MANTPNYDLPLFDSNAIPSWLRDWNSAMTSIDTAIHDVAVKQTGFQTSVDNAVTTANGAAATAQNVSTSVGNLETRVAALEAGGGGSGGFNPDNYQVNVSNVWTRTCAPVNIPTGVATATVTPTFFSGYPGGFSTPQMLRFRYANASSPFAEIKNPAGWRCIVDYTSQYALQFYRANITVNINNSLSLSDMETVTLRYTNPSTDNNPNVVMVRATGWQGFSGEALQIDYEQLVTTATLAAKS